MTGRNWITSHEASTKLREAGIGLEVLRIWAEEGLAARASSMMRNGEPDTIPGGLDIPSEFWLWMRLDPSALVEWAGGIFAVTVQAGLDDDPRFCERWQMNGVSFDGDELSRLIEVAQKGTIAEKANNVAATAPERWQAQRLNEQQKQLFRFFGLAPQHLRGGEKELSKVQLHVRYVTWAKKDNPRLEPFKRSGFEKWLDRYQDGWRIADGRLSLSQ